MSDDNGESALSRWSRRKVEAQQATPERAQQPSPESLARLDVPETEAVEAPLLTDADMPDVDSLTEDSDFSGFMSAGVSDELRNLALRKLFRASVFNIRDGLDEYDEDYTSFEKLGDIVTCDMKHQVEMQEKKLREAEKEAAEQVELEEVEFIEDDEDDMDTVDDMNRQEQPASVADTGQEATENVDE